METYYAKIESDIVVAVEVVTDEFFNSNPQRYTGKWLKVGGDSKRDFCGKGYIYLPAKDKIVPPQPFPSWTLDPVTDEWAAPTPKPKGSYTWDEEKLSWILINKDDI